MPEVSLSLFEVPVFHVGLMPHQPEEVLASCSYLFASANSKVYLSYFIALYSCLFVIGFGISYMQDDFSQGK